jgi:hypothetical protein
MYGNSLIGLPEGFNYGRSYYLSTPQPPRFPLDESFRRLEIISARHGVTFVVGLLDSMRNSAYLIDGGYQPRLIHHKQVPDSTSTYAPCETDCDGENPIEQGGALIGVLICNEAEGGGSGTAARLRQRPGARKVICIPACMTSLVFSSDLQSDCWQGSFVVLANRRPHPDGCRSFVADLTGQKLAVSQKMNQIVLSRW